MPHECTNCGRMFPDGSKQMLEGCPDCGGKKFQFRPADRDERPEKPAAGTEEDAAQASARSEVASEAEVGSGAWFGGGSAGEVGSDTRDTDDADTDDPIQAVDGDEHEGRWGTEDEGLDRPPSPERPNLEELREELNEQFESIKIVQPGRYELNLMELYDRGEYIVALEEDGKYVIDVPQARGEQP